ncbi:MAG: DUF6377 domain-containing protein [Candidatus Azobacteroides sp.]|nr:DUF6377 domain-containing protein [Candidatus Azobacteroides sp.]
MKRLFSLIILLVFVAPSLWSRTETDSIFQALSQAMRDKKMYMSKREQHIKDIKQLLKTPDLSDYQIYSIQDQLQGEYNSYKIDSAVYYGEQNLKIAEKLNNLEYIYDTKLNLSFSYWLEGRFIEALNLLDNLDRKSFDILPERLLISYYESYKRLFRYYASDDKNSPYYAIGILYRDSLLNIVPENSQSYRILSAEKLSDENDTQGAAQLLLEAIQLSTSEDHERAIFYNLLATVYKQAGDWEPEKKYYALSAICDLKNAIMENASMMALAMLLYEEGDIDNAYKCMKSSFEDAVFCNARFRTFEISKIFPIIDSDYQEKTARQKSELQKYLVAVSFLSLFLIAAVIYVYLQMKRIARIRKELYRTNVKLNQLNHDLQESNNRLLEVNHKLAETNRVKEAYLGKFIDLCSSYIEKLDNYRRNLNKIANSGKTEELLKLLKSSRFIDEELNWFYTNFDETFLRIYPTFISDFNALFPEGEKQAVKPGELLNTELRLYALIRLGINDSAKIAVFLRYSITTVYTYRSKLKNKSLFPENLEEQVMKIGSFAL